jgi:hypothetical protein
MRVRPLTCLRAGRPLARAIGTLCLGLACATSAVAQAQGEALLKVRITLSLTRFAQWPGHVPELLRLCLAQRDPAISQAFAEVDGQLVNGRRVQIVRVPPVVGCNVLFVHASADRAAELIRAASSGATLIIGDGDGTLTHGGMVELVPVNDALRFDINLAAVKQAQLGLSSQVLKLARQVRE